MQSQTRTTYIRFIARSKGPFARLVDWLIAADQRHKDKCRLRDAEEHVLRDMGMTRADADQAFYRRWGGS